MTSNIKLDNVTIFERDGRDDGAWSKKSIMERYNFKFCMVVKKDFLNRNILSFDIDILKF